METIINNDALSFKKWTYQDYLKLDDEKRYEIINTELILTPAPSSDHQDSSNNLSYLITDFVKKNKLGKVFCAPYDVIISENNVIQPDITFISNENINLIQKRGFFGVPDLVIEIVSPSSLKRDLEVKRAIYEKFGVKEYWIIFTSEKAIEVLNLKDNKYEVFEFLSLEDEEGIFRIKSKLLEGFEINLKEVFEL